VAGFAADQWKGQEYVDLYIYSPIRLRDMVLKYLNTGIILMLLPSYPPR
jgi:hypothetical protein